MRLTPVSGGRALLAVLLIAVLLAPALPGAAQTAPPLRPFADGRSDLFGMVGRDPHYEFNTNPVEYPNASNRTALEREAAELREMGVRWVRMEFWTDGDT